LSLVRHGDAVVVALAALLVGAAWASLWRGGGPAEYAEVTAPGGATTRLELAMDTVDDIQGRIGVSRIEVREGRVRFAEAPCVGRQCIHSGWLSRSGQVAACLPNGVVVEVFGRDRQYDAVTF
jgi:hypothetical protein